MKTRSIEIQRFNVTLAQFYSYVKRQCAKKGLELYVNRDQLGEEGWTGGYILKVCLDFGRSYFNEIFEFTFDDQKKGSGYYFQLNREAAESAKVAAAAGAAAAAAAAAAAIATAESEPESEPESDVT